MTASTPGFWRPIELSIPPGVSVTRGVGLPMRGLEGRALAADRAEPLDVDDVAVLDAVAERPRRDEDRVRQDEAAPEVDRQVDRARGGSGAARPRRRPLARRRGRAGSAATPARRARVGGRRARGLGRRPVAGAPVAPEVTTLRLAFTQAPSQSSSSAAKTGPSRQTRCGVPLVAMTTQPRHAPTAQPMFCSIETCRKAFRRAAGEPGGSGLPPPRFRPSVATPSRCAATGGLPGERGEHRRSGRRRRPGRPTPRTRARGRSRSRDGRASRRRWRRRTRPRRAAGSTGRPRAQLAAPNRSVTWRPSRIASSASIRTPAMPRPPAMSSRCWLRGSTSNGRPSGPSMSTWSPGRSRVNQSVPRPMTRKWIVTMPVAASVVLSENGRRRTIPEKSPVRTWTNWPAREPVARSGA